MENLRKGVRGRVPAPAATRPILPVPVSQAGHGAWRIDPEWRGRHTNPMAAPIQTAASHSSKHLREHASCDTSSPERVLSNLQKTSLDHGNLRAVRSLSAHSKRRDLASPTDNFYCGYQKWRRRVGRSQGVSQDYCWRETTPLGGGRAKQAVSTSAENTRADN
jgi:hypothetical protein